MYHNKFHDKLIPRDYLGTQSRLYGGDEEHIWDGVPDFHWKGGDIMQPFLMLELVEKILAVAGKAFLLYKAMRKISNTGKGKRKRNALSDVPR